MDAPGGSLAPAPQQALYTSAFNLAVLIAGLGYFVDTYDFFLYNGMRVVSLTELGLAGDSLTKTGITILNCQIFGALLGSFIWGVLGDRIGRKKALLASIFVYSLGMIANGFVNEPTIYSGVRFVIGFGVAGEVGLGATLIAETVGASQRTYALMFFTLMGVLGVTAAGACIELTSWRTSCFLGGGFGLLLLSLRGLLVESSLFQAAAHRPVPRGSLAQLFGKVPSLSRYLLCIPLLGCNFFVTGLLLTLSPEVARATGTPETIKATYALGLYFLFAVLGDCLGAWLSQRLRSRRLVVAIFLGGNVFLSALLLQRLSLPAVWFYLLCATFGIFNLWAITATILVELFPTEIRATATTSNINCSRASIIAMNVLLLLLKPLLGITSGLLIVGAVIFAVAFFCLWRLPETFACSLDEA